MDENLWHNSGIRFVKLPDDRVLVVSGWLETSPPTVELVLRSTHGLIPANMESLKAEEIIATTQFTFGERTYTVPFNNTNEWCDSNIYFVKLPDGRILSVGWLESLPPRPQFTIFETSRPIMAGQIVEATLLA